jgi:hypothetical protein
VTNETKVTLLGYDEDVQWDILSTGELVVIVPPQQDLPAGAEWGFTLKLRYLANGAVKNKGNLSKKISRPAMPQKDDLTEPWLKSSFIDIL